MALVYYSPYLDPTPWLAAFRRLMPELEIRVWPDIGDPRDVEVFLAWRPPPGELTRYPNLRLLQAFGAGVDQILADPTIPPDLPVARLVDDAQTAAMTQYVLAAVLRYHRRLDEFAKLQAASVWRQIPHADAADRTIGFLGMGVLGTDAALAMTRLGFDVAGWSRSPKGIPGVASHHGEAGLAAMLERTQILVCLLPLTPDTKGILNRSLFERLPRGAWLVNAARGRHLVEEDLLAALDSGRIAGATLDVFRDEPLPTEHPFWRHPGITLTPHIATIPTPRTAAAQILDNVRRLRAGLPPKHLVDRAAGY